MSDNPHVVVYEKEANVFYCRACGAEKGEDKFEKGCTKYKASSYTTSSHTTPTKRTEGRDFGSFRKQILRRELGEDKLGNPKQTCQCQICGEDDIVRTIEAAHIVDLSNKKALHIEYSKELNSAEKHFPGSINDMENGILLCSKCHSFFNKPNKYIVIEEDGTIRCSDDAKQVKKFRKLDGKKVPWASKIDSDDYPSTQFLAWAKTQPKGKSRSAGKEQSAGKSQSAGKKRKSRSFSSSASSAPSSPPVSSPPKSKKAKITKSFRGPAPGDSECNCKGPCVSSTCSCLNANTKCHSGCHKARAKYKDGQHGACTRLS